MSLADSGGVEVVGPSDSGVGWALGELAESLDSPAVTPVDGVSPLVGVSVPGQPPQRFPLVHLLPPGPVSPLGLGAHPGVCPSARPNGAVNIAQLYILLKRRHSCSRP